MAISTWTRLTLRNPKSGTPLPGTRAAVGIALALFCQVVPAVGAQEPPSPAPAQVIRREIMAGQVDGASHGDLARYRPALLRVYADSTARALWLADGRPTRQAETLLAELGAAETRGLRGADYDAEPLARTLLGVRSSARDAINGMALLRADAWLTLSAMRFMDHAHRGRVDPRALGFALPGTHGHHDLVPLVMALSRAPDVHAMLDSLEPRFARFRALEALLSRYRSLAADSTLTALPQIATTVRPGDRWSGMVALQRLLVALGDIPGTAVPTSRAERDSFGNALVAGVKQFQRRHGLVPDGVLGAATLAQLRTPLAGRVAQIEVTMERWRWLPDITSSRLVVVNIPAFRLYAFDRTSAGERPVERMDVIVGSAYGGRHTPVFASEMRDVVFHPYWDVPPSIARHEEIPRILRDPGYAEREGLEIVRGGDVGATAYPMTGANLQRVAAGTLRLRQRPGPRNALGPVKFVFPNRYNVYLHGTPAQSLFARTRRDFSHGCIRTSDPARLAEFVLKGEEGWDRARIEAAMSESGAMLRVGLGRPLPVYILYATVVGDEEGIPFFYPDLYGHDAALARALRLPVAPPRLVAPDGVMDEPRVGGPAGDCLTANESSRPHHERHDQRSACAMVLVTECSAPARTSVNTVCSLSSGNADDRLSGELKPASDADVGRYLARRFEDAIHDASAEAMAALHAATIAVAASMRATVLEPERAVIMLKTLLRSHGGAGWAPSLAVGRSSLSTRPETLAYQELFAWWVTAYYADPV